MQQVRSALWKDEQALKKLWKICFQDSDEFIEWFFKNRFIPDLCICLEENEQIVTAMYAYPLHIKLRGVIVPSAMLCGFCTHPDFRHKGYLRRCFHQLMQTLSNHSIAMTVLTPVRENGYDEYGHHSSTLSQYLTFTAKDIPNSETNFEKLDLQKDAGALFWAYHDFSQSYSGMVSRSMSDMALKCADYLSDFAQCICIKSKGKIEAYCIYYISDKMITAAETVAQSPSQYEQIIFSLSKLYPDFQITLKLPADIQITIPGIKSVLKPQANSAVSDASKLLELVGKQLPYCVRITDTIITKNNGVFSFSGEKTQSKAQIELPSGRLMQFLQGYYSLNQLAKLDANVKITDITAAEQLDRLFPPLECFIVDEY